MHLFPQVKKGEMHSGVMTNHHANDCALGVMGYPDNGRNIDVFHQAMTVEEKLEVSALLVGICLIVLAIQV
jgi:hypothetical protein